MGVFILCWLPFFVTNVLIGLCPESCISDPQLVYSIFTWLGWLNSGMNPVIYACWSRDFRKAFKKVLCSLLFCCRASTSAGEISVTQGSSAYYGTTAATTTQASYSSACRTRSSSATNEHSNQSDLRDVSSFSF